MPTQPIDSLYDLVAKHGLMDFLNSDPTASSFLYVNSSKKVASNAVTTSKPVYIDSSGVPQSAALPFAMLLAAGANDSSLSTFDISGRATGSANELMHLNLVLGSNATATVAGYTRVTVTDAAGVITNGAYYMPFYTLA